jgi:cytochrome c553
LLRRNMRMRLSLRQAPPFGGALHRQITRASRRCEALGNPTGRCIGGKRSEWFRPACATRLTAACFGFRRGGRAATAGTPTTAAQTMIKTHLSTILAALVISAALAAPADAADDIAEKLQVCSSCHGDNGQPINAITPIIWGQQEYFLVKQLHDYKAGDRENPVMAAFANTLTQAELRPAARYFASKSWPARRTAAAATPEPKGLTVCQICHQPNFVGGLPAPRLAGQSYEYLLAAMNSFASGARTNNADMVKLMEGLSPAERDEIARYISSL